MNRPPLDAPHTTSPTALNGTRAAQDWKAGLTAEQLEARWATDKRWSDVTRSYSGRDVLRLGGSFGIEHTLAARGAARLWDLLHTEDYVNALGALTGNQAMQQVKAGLKAIYVSGW